MKWFEPQVSGKELHQLSRVINSNYLNDGWATRELEDKISRRIGVKFAVGVSSGTAALTLSLLSLGVGQGDEVMVPNLTFIGTANAVRLTGADVKLVDIEPKRLSIDPDKVKKGITRKTKAVVSVEVNGRPCLYGELNWLKKEGIHLVTDSCEAFGSGYKGKLLGTFGCLGCFSFSPNKTLTTGQGGMVVTNMDYLYKRLLQLKNQGKEYQGTGGDDEHESLGFNFKLSNLQSAVGLAQFERLEERLNNANKRDEWYRRHLKYVPGIRFLPKTQGEFLQWTDIVCEDRESVEKKLRENNISYRNYWRPLNTQPPYLYKGDFKVSEEMSKKMMWLPSSFDLTENDVIKIAEVLN